MKLTRKLIEALITEEERVEFNTTYKNQNCKVSIGDGYFVLEFADKTMLQQNEEDIQRGDCFPFDTGIDVYTSTKQVHLTGTLFLEHFGNLETI